MSMYCKAEIVNDVQRSESLTRTVLGVLLILWMEVVNGISHDVLWIHCFLQGKKIYDVKQHKLKQVAINRQDNENN